MIKRWIQALAVAVFWVLIAVTTVSSLSWTLASGVIVLITAICGRSLVWREQRDDTLWLPDGVCLLRL